jgi:hypothetical protein
MEQPGDAAKPPVGGGVGGPKSEGGFGALKKGVLAVVSKNREEDELVKEKEKDITDFWKKELKVGQKALATNQLAFDRLKENFRHEKKPEGKDRDMHFY